MSSCEHGDEPSGSDATELVVGTHYAAMTLNLISATVS
jgi:hypothetical protein